MVESRSTPRCTSRPIFLLLAILFFINPSASGASVESAKRVTGRRSVRERGGSTRPEEARKIAEASTETSSQEKRKVRKTQEVHRRLPEGDIVAVLNGLVDTPIDAWTTEQWIVAVAILLLMWVCCCGGASCCRGGGGSRYGYYPYGRSPYRRSSSGSCCRDILLCLCCYEFCCRGCEDVCPGGMGGGEAAGDYAGGQMV